MAATSPPPPLGSLTVALDWTPACTHVGLYVALARGLFARRGLAVTLVPADADEYATTPAQKVGAGAAHLGIGPSETVISLATLPGRPAARPLVAVAALAAADTSAIVTLASSAFDRPAALGAGGRYASYKARFEDAIVRAVVEADGGDPAGLVVSHPPKLGIWATVETGAADATWVFEPWEVTDATRRGVALRSFRLADYGVPYGYTPLLFAAPALLAARPAAVAAFLAAADEGYRFAAAHPADAADAMMTAAGGHPSLADAGFVRAACAALAPALLDPATGAWGRMEPARWATFVAWLQSRGILTEVDTGSPIETLDVGALFTNDHLPALLLQPAPVA